MHRPALRLVVRAANRAAGASFPGIGLSPRHGQQCHWKVCSSQSKRSALAPVVTLDTLARVKSADVPPEPAASAAATAAVGTVLNPKP